MHLLLCRSILHLNPRVQAFCKSHRIRRAYLEVHTTSRILQRYARTFLAYRKFQDMKDSDDPALTKEKKREILQKILNPKRYGATKVGLSGRKVGKRRRFSLQATKVKGDEVAEEEFTEMPRFNVEQDGWLNVRIGKMNKAERRYVSLKQGTLTVFQDQESLEALLSYNLAGCVLEGYTSGVDRSKATPSSPQTKLRCGT